MKPEKYVVSLSGGKDSTAMLLRLLEETAALWAAIPACIVLGALLGSLAVYAPVLGPVLALGCVTACMQLGMRKKGSRSWLVCMGLTFLLVLNLSVQYTAGRSTGIFHAITALLVGLGFLGFGLTQTHNGKDGLADEVE